MFAVSCPHCGRKLKMKPEQAGRTFPCPVCQKPVTVPAAAGDATIDSNSADEREQRVARSEHGCDGRGDAEQGPAPRPSHPAQGVPPGLSQAPSPKSPAPSLAAQRFVVVDEIGRGGMGAVVRANDCEIRREVAVKYLLDQRDPQKKARFIEEAQITGQLEHPNIVPVHELGLDAEGKLYFTMKMVRGRSLKEVLDEQRTTPNQSEWSQSRLLGVLVNVCHALAYAHSRGVVHRDLKPANIMVGDFGEVYVMDWGLAKVLASPTTRESEPHVGPEDVTISPSTTQQSGEHDSVTSSGSGSSAGAVSTDRGADSTALTMDGSILGTPVYMPPEQAAGDIKAIDARSDIYSLGAILYELLTLQPPVDKSGGHMAVLKRVVAGEIAPPETRNPKRARAGMIPQELSAVAMKALSLKPADRYQTVEALRRDIELFLEGRSVSAKRDSAWEQVVKLVKRNKGVSVALGVLVPLLVGVLVYSSITNYYAREATAKAYQDYQDQVKKSVPAFVEAARLAAEQRLYDNAMRQVDVALASDDSYPDAHLLKGQLLIARQDFAGARSALSRYLQLEPSDARAKKLLELCQDAQPDDVARLLPIATVLSEQQAYALVNGLLSKYGKNSDEARQFLLKMYQGQIEKAWPGKGAALTIDTRGLHLDLSYFADLTDLSRLKGIPLTTLNCSYTRVADLAPLRGMPLTVLACNQTSVADLSPLRGMPLTTLYCHQTGVADLSPLQGMRLTTLSCGGTRIADLAPLHGMPLTMLYCHGLSIPDLAVLKGMPLTDLICSGCPRITDLSPLRGMRLTTLSCDQTAVADLSPLTGMPLTALTCSRTAVADLSPLKGMALTRLICGATAVTDLSPLKGMTLTLLWCNDAPISDLSALTGMPLRELLCSNTRVLDLSPLEGMNLTMLRFSPEKVTRGIDVIRGMKSLTQLQVGDAGGTGYPAPEFWERYDARTLPAGHNPPVKKP